MRPRHKAAEHDDNPHGRRHVTAHASMRPRHKAAEHQVVEVTDVIEDVAASMRPRHKAAEHAKGRMPLIHTLTSFNEAAA